MEITSEFHFHKGRLPHWQVGGRVYFITFRSSIGILPPEALMIVKHHILFDHRRRYDLIFAVIMPDHVHLLLNPLQKGNGIWFDLATIMKGIKGTSAVNINRILNKKGEVWQREYFDRMIRDENELLEKWEYMWNNPLKAGLANSFDEYNFYVNPDEKEYTY